MSKFTKGTWRYDGPMEWAGTANERRYEIVTEDGEFIIAVVPGNIEADARLIAAAPEMYELLYEALQELKGYEPIENMISTVYPDIEELLARVDGEENQS